MRAIGDLLGEVLANTAKLVAERKIAGGLADRFQPQRETFTTDDPLPAQRGQVPKTSGGDKRR